MRFDFAGKFSKPINVRLDWPSRNVGAGVAVAAVAEYSESESKRIGAKSPFVALFSRLRRCNSEHEEADSEENHSDDKVLK